jgi:protein SCO1/2
MQRRQATAFLMGAALALPHTAWAGKWLHSPDVPDVSLLDHRGKEVDLNQMLRTRPVVVNFFFTGCATVCPPQTALLREATLLWRKLPMLEKTLVISISVDGLGDGPKQLEAYAKRFNLPLGEDQGWVFLTGPVASLSRVLGAFNVPLGRPDDHPALLWLGDGVRGRWTRASALNPPATTTRILTELTS